MAFGHQKVRVYGYFGPNSQSHSCRYKFDECDELSFSRNGTKSRFDEYEIPWNGHMTTHKTVNQLW